MRFSYQIGMCDPDHYLPLARAAEEAGYHGIAVSDSICYPQEASSKYPYNKDGSREFLESVPFVELPDLGGRHGGGDGADTLFHLRV